MNCEETPTVAYGKRRVLYTAIDHVNKAHFVDRERRYVCWQYHNGSNVVSVRVPNVHQTTSKLPVLFLPWPTMFTAYHRTTLFYNLISYHNRASGWTYNLASTGKHGQGKHKCRPNSWHDQNERLFSLKSLGEWNIEGWSGI